jgi:hypothetical protein
LCTKQSFEGTDAEIAQVRLVVAPMVGLQAVECNRTPSSLQEMTDDLQMPSLWARRVF